MERVVEQKRYFLSRREAASRMMISIGTFDNLLRRKQNPMPSLRVGHKILIPLDQFENWVAEESAKGSSGWDR